MDIDGDTAFDKVLDRLIDTAADLRLGQEKRTEMDHQHRMFADEFAREKRKLADERSTLYARVSQLEAALTKAGIAIPPVPTEDPDQIPF